MTNLRDYVIHFTFLCSSVVVLPVLGRYDCGYVTINSRPGYKCDCFNILPYIDCNRNGIAFMPNFTAEQKENIHYLFLKNNALTTISREEFEPETWPELATVYLENNPQLDCGSINWMYEEAWNTITDTCGDGGIVEGTETEQEPPEVVEERMELQEELEELPRMIEGLEQMGVDLDAETTTADGSDVEVNESTFNFLAALTALGLLFLLGLAVFLAIKVYQRCNRPWKEMKDEEKEPITVDQTPKFYVQ